jgi:hypothetical protein
MTKRFDVLAAEIDRHDYRIGAEIGVQGGMTYKRLLACPSIERLYAVDEWRERPDHVPGNQYLGWKHETNEATVRRLAAESGKGVVLQMDSTAAAGKIGDGELDFVFIDADHSTLGVWSDIRAWWPKVREGGLVAGHDVIWPSVHHVVHGFFAARTYRIASDSTWLVTKEGGLSGFQPEAGKAALLDRVTGELKDAKCLH